jgi:hypothetical protein
MPLRVWGFLFREGIPLGFAPDEFKTFSVTQSGFTRIPARQPFRVPRHTISPWGKDQITDLYKTEFLLIATNDGLAAYATLVFGPPL